MHSGGELPRRLGLLDSSAIVVGTIIGSGIFVVPNLVARSLPSEPWILAAWVVTGAVVQKAFTLMKILGLAVLMVAAFLGARHEAAPPAPSVSGSITVSGFGVAMIACLLSYDGWVALSFVAGEVKDPKRNLPL